MYDYFLNIQHRDQKKEELSEASVVVASSSPCLNDTPPLRRLRLLSVPLSNIQQVQ